MSDTVLASAPLLAVAGLTRRFPGVLALDTVDLDLHPGEIHCVIGENGAGKSTLMKILAGIQPPSAGSVALAGRPRTEYSPQAAEADGIVMVHQELNLVDELTVAANIFLGREHRRGWRLDHARMQREADEWLARVGASCRSHERIAELGIAQRQLVEIAKALSRDARVLILDEPSAVLGAHEIERLHAVVRQLRDADVGVLSISHHLREVQALADRVTVLRDGRVAAHLAGAEVPAGRAGEVHLAELMVGREMGEHFPERGEPVDETVLAVQAVSCPPLVREVSLELRRGEVLGLAGLVGAGRSELGESIAGLRPRPSGTVCVADCAVPAERPRAALRAGIAYLSEDRRGAGLVLGRSIRDNATLAALRQMTTAGGLVSRARERTAVADLQARLAIRMSDPEADIATLSGGNQQKVAIGKWLLTRPQVLILDEPTRGVDIGAKEEIYRLIHELAAEGLGCLCISSELPELLGLCHRIAVMRRGHLVQVVDAADASEQSLMVAASGITDAAANGVTPRG